MKKLNLLLSLMCFFLLSIDLYANKVTVTNNNDSGSGSLRIAVSSASSGDTIIFASGLNNKTIKLTTGEIAIEKTLTIIGPGAALLIISGELNSRIFSNTSCNVTISIDGLTLARGNVNGNGFSAVGGAISSCSILNISNSVITDNHVLGDGPLNSGGGIYSSGTLNLINSKVTANTSRSHIAIADAGGIYCNNATIKNSEISFNLASGFGSGSGGIKVNNYLYLENSSVYENATNGNTTSANAGGITTINPNATMTIINSTISSNDGVARGTASGGIVNSGILNLVNTTVTLNIASFESGIYGSGILNLGTLNISNSIVAKNGPSNASGVDGRNLGVLNDGGYNLIGINDGFNLSSPTDKLGTLASPLDPLLGPLKNNGGNTLTHALLTGSLAIDQGNPKSTLAQDQRGIARPFNGIIDIGSYEVSGTPPAVAITSPASGSLFTEPANITITASVSGAGQGAYLQVTNPIGGYRKLKIGYDSIGIYHGSQNVIATGNNTLEITLRDFTGTADWTKLEVRPNGKKTAPLSLAPYVAAVGGLGNSFKTIRIPLSDFSSIDFTHLVMFELPYSNNASAFNIGIQKIIFTGGTTPFLWFGDRKTDNSFDGTGGPGELVATLKPAVGFGGVNNVAFFNGNTKIGEDVTAPYSIVWKNVPDGTYNLTARATTNNGTVVTSSVIIIKVLPSALVDFSEERAGVMIEQAIKVYPNPVQEKLNISGINGKVLMSIYNDLGDKVIEQTIIDGSQGEVDVSSLPTGAYIMRLDGLDNKGSKTVKVLKE